MIESSDFTIDMQLHSLIQSTYFEIFRESNWYCIQVQILFHVNALCRQENADRRKRELILASRTISGDMFNGI
jgi:hypothetical protein